MDGSQRGRDTLGSGDVIEAHHAYVLGNLIAKELKRIHQLDCHPVVSADKDVRQGWHNLQLLHHELEIPEVLGRIMEQAAFGIQLQMLLIQAFQERFVTFLESPAYIA